MKKQKETEKTTSDTQAIWSLRLMHLYLMFQNLRYLFSEEFKSEYLTVYEYGLETERYEQIKNVFDVLFSGLPSYMTNWKFWFGKLPKARRFDRLLAKIEPSTAIVGDVAKGLSKYGLTPAKFLEIIGVVETYVFLLKYNEQKLEIEESLLIKDLLPHLGDNRQLAENLLIWIKHLLFYKPFVLLNHRVDVRGQELQITPHQWPAVDDFIPDFARMWKIQRSDSTQKPLFGLDDFKLIYIIPKKDTDPQP